MFKMDVKFLDFLSTVGIFINIGLHKIIVHCLIN